MDEQHREAVEREAPGPTAFCDLCVPPRRMPTAELMEHLSREHDYRPGTLTPPADCERRGR